MHDEALASLGGDRVSVGAQMRRLLLSAKTLFTSGW